MPPPPLPMTLLFGNPFDWLSFGVWTIITFTVFLGLYIPVWRSEWWKRWETPRGRLSSRGGTSAMRYHLFYPPLWINGPVWSLAFTLSALSITLLIKKGRELSESVGLADDASLSTLVEVAILLWFLQIWIHGIWTIYFFYWGLPLWSILHLMLAGCLAIAYAVVAAYVTLTALWFYLFFLILTWLVALANLWIFLGYTRRPLVIGNPLAMWCKRGFNPVPWAIYDYERGQTKINKNQNKRKLTKNQNK